MESASKMLALFSCPKEVSITPYLSKDQIAAAREMDLLTYLRRFELEELVHIGGDTYATRTHDSLKISNGKWCWWSRNIGGTNALDYLTRVEGLSFLDAVQRILGELPRVPPTPMRTAPLLKTEFTLPPKHADTRRVFAYLRSRGMTQEELAAALSITPNHLGKIEMGKRGISFDVLLGVSEVLDISLDLLIKGKRHISPQVLQLIGQMRIALDQLEGNERNPD